jgi:hypothetical protein
VTGDLRTRPSELGKKLAQSIYVPKQRYALCILAVFAGIAGLIAQQTVRRDIGDLPPGKSVLWVNPGDPSRLDFEYGPGGKEHQPQPPFRFVDEDMSGTHAKVNITDARGAHWNIKWGSEATSSAFCTRLVWACGYFVEPEYFVASGRIAGAHGLKRAKSYIHKDGSFEHARFQLRREDPKFLDDRSWTWTDNPFLHTHQLQGLKILMLLVSNWDAKDARDRANGRMDSNLAIFADDTTGVRRYLYAQDDWGGTLGQWGNRFTWSRGNCSDFAAQTPEFVKGVKNGYLRWGYEGKHREDMTSDISVADVQWLLQYLGRITDAQIQRGLVASGARPKEQECYAKSLRLRIAQLQQAVTQAPERITKAAVQDSPKH